MFPPLKERNVSIRILEYHRAGHTLAFPCVEQPISITENPLSRLCRISAKIQIRDSESHNQIHLRTLSH